MTPEQIKRQLMAFGWERWIERPFGAFMMSLFKDGITREAMRKLGVDAEYEALIFERGAWYQSVEVTKPFASQVKSYLASGHTVFDISHSCEQFYKEKKKRIQKLVTETRACTKKLAEVYDILSTVTSYIWLAHGMEDVYTELLRKEAARYVTEDIDVYIGDLSFPIKKNAHTRMEEDILAGKDLAQVARLYGWIRARDGFSEGFTVDELREERKGLLKAPKEKHIASKIPEPLQQLVKEAQELVYYRTLRTDVLYELLFLARPILEEVAMKYNLSFQDLRDYTIQNLISGTLKRHPQPIACGCYKGNMAFFDRPILPQEQATATEIKGMIAFRGIIQGTAKIVNTVQDLGKVKEGDIMITPMTFPSFIMAMKLAAAFVTNEGGMTCHAAIVAREMRKPCIVGTKVATKILKDGDTVEVDANKGIVKKL